MGRRDPALHPPQSRSGLVPRKPSVVFSWEPFSSIVRELPPLFRQHWLEIALNQDVISLDPNFDLYLHYEVAGILHVMTVRVDGRLAGYLFAVIGPHLHYVSTPFCVVDMFWLDPALRKGWTGIRMFQHLESRARVYGARVIHISVKLHFKDARVGSLLEFLGYSAIETTHAKHIG